jgi:hypothetical protein
MTTVTLLHQEDLLRMPEERPTPKVDLRVGELVVQNMGPDQALRATFPEALLIKPPVTPKEWVEAMAQTQTYLMEQILGDAQAHEGRAILGACLASDDGAMVRVDVLAAGTRGVRVFKVRHATVGDEQDVDVVALWAHVVARAGLRVESVGLLLVNTDFVYPGHGCYAGLFREYDLSPVLGSRPVPAWLVAMRSCERGPEPELTADAPCTKGEPCDAREHCQVAPLEDRFSQPASLEVVGRELAHELRDEGHTSLLTVPEQRLPDERRRRAWRAIQSGQPELDPAVTSVMQAQPHPRYFLRFDTIGFATPIWPGTRPYQIMPFQWTCDMVTQPGALVRRAFLADLRSDPRRAFAESLLRALGQSGAILAYNAGFERNRIRELATLFEDLSEPLQALLPRLHDLFHTARAHYYHPSMCGSWSFKSIARAVAPDLGADRFEWAGLHTPQAAFAHSAQARSDSPAQSECREALLAHGRNEAEVLRRMVALFESAT